jgi:nitrogen regulatory protein P-II 1
VADRLMDRIVEVCQTGQIGDGVVWKTDVDRVFFIAKNYGTT